MIDASLFTRPAFTASIATNLVLVFAVAGMGMLAVTHLQTVLGLTPLMAAVWTLPTMVGTVIGVTAASILARTVRPGILVTVALVIVAGGFGIVSTLTVDSGPPRLIAGYSLLAVGIGLASTVVTSLVLTTAPPEKAGAASAVSETSNELGGALGIAILGTLSASIYQGAMSTVSLPGLPPEAGQAATETIGGAMAVVEQLPPETADQLLQQAFAASTDGLTTSAMVGSVLLAVAAVVVGLGLRKVPS